MMPTIDREVMKGLSPCGKNTWLSLYLITGEGAHGRIGESFRIPTIFLREDPASIADVARIVGKRGLIAVGQ